MSILSLLKPDRALQGEIELDGSKSISNRALIILALSGAKADDYLTGLSTSKDTRTLQKLLQGAPEQAEYDAGDAGTTFRFLTAFLATQPGTQVLTGSHRMKERPVGLLAHALRDLGAEIEFLEKEGYPPLKIGDPGQLGKKNRRVEIDGGTSSQFLSALLMVAPYFQNGLELVPTGKLVSRPYLEMTIRLMRYFGADVAWQGESIVVQPGQYTPRTFRVEADWSAASYWYAMAAFADEVDLTLRGLSAESLQGDAVLANMFEKFGITSTFGDNQVHLRKNGQPPRPMFEQDFVECPDIAQTLAVVCAGLGVQGLFTGLETLSIKETDRIAAIRTELKKVHATFVKLPPHFSKKQPDKTFYLVDDKAHWEAPPRFATYGDHRMAMAFAPLAFLGNIEIEKPEVVEKSYPRFWEDLQTVGFQIS